MNLINAYTTTASHENARTALARIARSVLAGLTAQGVTKARRASPKEIRRSGLKAVTMATMLVRGKRTGQVTFGRFSVGVTVRRERRWTTAGATRPGTGSLHPVIEAAAEATKLSELSMERVALRLRERAGRNVSER